MEETHHNRGWIRIMDAASIVVYSSVAIFMASRVWQGMEGASPWNALLVALLAVASYALADLVSGVVHCAADNFGEEDLFFLGTAFIKPFREHHRDPDGITRHDFFEVNGNSCLVNLLVLLPVYFLIPISTSYWGALAGAFALSFTLAIVCTNQFHKWAHQTNPAPHVRFLQSMNLVLTPEVHKVHHKAPFDRYYCITAGWLNPVLEKVGFFHWIHVTFDWARPKVQRGGESKPVLKSA